MADPDAQMVYVATVTVGCKGDEEFSVRATCSTLAKAKEQMQLPDYCIWHFITNEDGTRQWYSPGPKYDDTWYEIFERPLL